jgi:arginyl-tRNA synthetase
MQSYLATQILRALDEMGDYPDDFVPEFQQPANPDHGDLSSNVALQLARHLRRAPQQIAGELAELMTAAPLDPLRIASVEIAGPGFLNFRFAEAYLFAGLREVLDRNEQYGNSDVGKGRRAIVEFVSANPTGPLTVGHGRNAVLGDTIARLLERVGFDVSREYYFNDAGRQMRVLGESVRARYLALVDRDLPLRSIGEGDLAVLVPESFPEDGYLGGYITEIAETLFAEHGADLNDIKDVEPFRMAAQERIFQAIEMTLSRMGIHMNTYFNEKTLYDSGLVWRIVEQFRDRGLAYDLDGAVWFRTTDFGKEKDTVLVKSTGEPTYRLPDIGYHVDKLERGFDVIVDIFGADHIATFPDVLNGVRALGYDADRIDVVIYQFVTLVRAGEPVKMSTRKAQYVTLDELMDEVGDDVTRFFFLMRSANTHLEFDLDLAREASEKNPVFYLQYAHARICSILRKAEEVGFALDTSGDLSILGHPAESALMKELLKMPDIVLRAAETREPHRIANYLREVAVAFSQFYGQCRIIGESPELASARMQLAVAARIVLHNGLDILGISAPEKM